MNSLNDDCLQDIFQYLTLKDQVAVLRSSQRFLYAIRSIWKTKFKNCLELALGQEMALEMDELKEFLSNLPENIEHFVIKSVNSDVINELREFQFYDARSLEITVDSSKPLEYEFVASLRDIFPNIKVFLPFGKFTGEGFILWKNLEKLRLTFCFSFDFEYLAQILRELPLHTLQLKAFKLEMPHLPEGLLQTSPLSELIVNSYELAYFTPFIKNLRQLKYLHISDLFSTFNINSLYNELENLRETLRINGISSHDIHVIFPKMIELGLHSHLERLLLSVDPMAFSEMLIFIPIIPTLSILYFRKCYVRSNEDFKELFLVSKHLDEISIENCTVTYDNNPCLLVSEVVEHRTKPLTFNYFGNKFRNDTKAELILKGHSNLLKLEYIPKNVRSYFYLLYEFCT